MSESTPLVYATAADLVALCGELELTQLRPDSSGYGFDAAVIELALANAQAVVDSYVGQVYVLPLEGCTRVVDGVQQQVAPPLLKHTTLDIARFALHHDLSDTHEVARRHKQARMDLEALARGKQALVCPWGGVPGRKLDAAQAAQDPGTGADSYAADLSGPMDEALRGFM